MADPYDVLGVDRKAPKAAVRKAYRAKVKAHHPDTGGSRGRFEQLKLAHDILTDDERRAHYDKTGVDRGEVIDTLRQEAIGIISSILQAAIRHDGVDMAEQDMVLAVRRCLKKNIEEAKKGLVGLGRPRARIDRIKGRFKHEGEGPNLFEDVLEWQLRAIEQVKIMLEHNVAVNEEALRLIEGYTFHVKQKSTADQMAVFGWSTVSSATSYG